jgi:membrane protein YqaA with SNARE-associated domain
VRTLFAFALAGSWGRSAIRFFVRLGVFGPFLLETLDSSFFYMPLANELLLVALIHSGGPRWMWVLYAAAGALGTVAGVLLLDLAVRRLGEGAAERLIGERKFERLKRRLEKRAGWAAFVAGALPPPFPFRVTMMAASALQTPRRTLLVSVFFGRLLRFGAEALLILYFGRRFIRVMESDAFEYALYALTAVAVAGTAFTVYRFYKSRGPRVATGAKAL